MATRKTAEGEQPIAQSGNDAPVTMAQPFPRTLKFGMLGEDVKALQRQLSVKGFNVPDSGIFDMDTVKAVRLVQRAQHKPESGILRPDDLAALFRE